MTSTTDENSSPIAKLETNFFSPSSTRSIFWKPRFSTTSPVLHHIPLLFWIGNLLQPRDIGVVDVGDGCAYFAFCQLIDKSENQGSCVGLGYWDTQTADKERQLELLDHESRFYEEISTLKALSKVEGIQEHFAANSLDILFVDVTSQKLENVEQINALISRLRSSGLLFVLGTNSPHFQEHSLKMIIEHWPDATWIEVPQSDGMTIFRNGESLSAPLQSLFARCNNGRMPVEFGTVFRRLGDSLLKAELNREISAELAKANELLTAVRAENENANDELFLLRDTVELRNKSLSECRTSIFDLRTINQELEASVQEAEAAVEHEKQEATYLQERIETFVAAKAAEANERKKIEQLLSDTQDSSDHYQSSLADADKIIGEHKDRIDALEGQLTVAALQQDRSAKVAKAEHYSETQILTSLIEGMTAEHARAISDCSASHENGNSSLQAELKGLKRSNADLVARNKHVTTKLQRMLDSSSWRITAPVRSIVDKVKK